MSIGEKIDYVEALWDRIAVNESQVPSFRMWVVPDVRFFIAFRTPSTSFFVTKATPLCWPCSVRVAGNLEEAP